LLVTQEQLKLGLELLCFFPQCSSGSVKLNASIKQRVKSKDSISVVDNDLSD